jgi:uncharacterized sporulation protein YeaH/YhbH (DUF444 family)
MIKPKGSMSMNIVDRRLNPQGKSLPNRQRYIQRAKEQIKAAVRKISGEDGIKDIGADKVWISTDGLKEHHITHTTDHGSRDIILPGNTEFEVGDTLPRPPKGGGRGSGGADSGDSQDAFQFALTQDEFLDIFFDDLELPHLLRKQMAGTDSFKPVRAGHTVSGSVSNLNLKRTMRNSLARRIALHRPMPAELALCEAEIAALEGDESAFGIRRRHDLMAELEALQRRSKRIPFIDPVDVRYNRFEMVPQPITSAVMFCLMDVSGSMTEHMKDLAKRFYKLLYLFLTRRYKRVEIVFIRHTHNARTVDEDTFFNDPESGGTVVSTAFDEMIRVAAAKYPRDQWNIYAAQASDGDNSSMDNAKVKHLLTTKILPMCQYFAYIEVGEGRDADNYTAGFAISGDGTSDLWKLYEPMTKAGFEIAMQRVKARTDIFPVFRALFSRDKTAKKVAA